MFKINSFKFLHYSIYAMVYRILGIIFIIIMGIKIIFDHVCVCALIVLHSPFLPSMHTVCFASFPHKGKGIWARFSPKTTGKRCMTVWLFAGREAVWKIVESLKVSGGGGRSVINILPSMSCCLFLLQQVLHKCLFTLVPLNLTSVTSVEKVCWWQSTWWSWVMV